jgi:predicted nucleic acid binding AN1-type Zn finger protein
MSEKHNKMPCKCHVCNKKLGLLPFDCRCGHQFCSIHRYPEEHKCSFDYKEFAKEQLEKTIVVKDLVQKIEKI